MGIDFMDVSFRMEKVFRLELGKDFWEVIFEDAKRESPDTPPTDVTVGQIHRELIRRLQGVGRFEDSAYLVEANLNEVQSKLKIHFPNEVITPDTKFVVLHGRPLWREDWYKLGDLFNVEMPQIGWSRWTNIVIGTGVLVCASVFIGSRFMDWPWTYPALFDILILTALITWRMNGEAKRFPPRIKAVRDLADHLLVVRTRLDQTAEWPEVVVWVALREILVNALGVDDDEVTPTATLIHDLGAS